MPSLYFTASAVSHAIVWTTMRTPIAPDSHDMIVTLFQFFSRNCW